MSTTSNQQSNQSALTLQSLVDALIQIVATESYRVDPVSPHTIPAASVMDAVRGATGWSEEWMNEKLGAVSKEHQDAHDEAAKKMFSKEDVARGRKVLDQFHAAFPSVHDVFESKPPKIDTSYYRATSRTNSRFNELVLDLMRDFNLPQGMARNLVARRAYALFRTEILRNVEISSISHADMYGMDPMEIAQSLVQSMGRGQRRPNAVVVVDADDPELLLAQLLTLAQHRGSQAVEIKVENGGEIEMGRRLGQCGACDKTMLLAPVDFDRTGNDNDSVHKLTVWMCGECRP